MEKPYYLGLDIGTNSVGYAVTDSDYHLLKFKGEPMWGAHTFEEASQCAERRGFRTARRRLDRRQQRVKLTQEIFAKEVAKADPNFFIRIQESALYREDTSTQDEFVFFCDENYSDQDYHKAYPTIHHLICELMESEQKHDVRLVYLAVAWLMAHRGHFLSEVNKDKIENILDFHSVYSKFVEYCAENEYRIWQCDETAFSEELLRKIGVKAKKAAFSSLLYGGKKPEITENDYVNPEMLIDLLCGATVDVKKLFPLREFEGSQSICFRKPQEEFEMAIAELDEDAELLIRLRAVYDWALLKDALNEESSISRAKVKIYEQHKADLTFLKRMVKTYIPDRYNEIFRDVGVANYMAYSYNFKNVDDRKACGGKATQEAFCDYLKKLFQDVIVAEADRADFAEMQDRLVLHSFMPKQVNGDNRVIPYQVYYHELKKILEKATNYLPFLKEADESGCTGMQKLLDIFEFRIPYYVGPLQEKSKHAWIVRKAEGKIYPWNFQDLVDLDASEEAFISRMMNTCTYLPGEEVLPKSSLMYEKFMVLNEINNIKINGEALPVEVKQEIYHLFEQNRKVTVKRITDYLKSNNLMGKEDVLSGIDITIKASLKSYHDFKRMLMAGVLTEAQAEDIIRRLTFSEDRTRSLRWLREHYSQLSDEDMGYLSKLKYADFGRLSKAFLSGMTAVRKSTGEIVTIMEALWDSNDNLMEILSEEKYGFTEVLEELRTEYYSEHPSSVEALLEDMYISNAVKRPIYRTLDIVSDVRKAMKCAPKKIFVEMARGGGEKDKRTKSRREQITEYYKQFPKEEVRELSLLLDGKSDNELQSEVLFLYFMQLGKCMYTGTALDIEFLKTNRYNVDHIFPQSCVKDDSITNKVLVLSEANGAKGDRYPIEGEIRRKMEPFWKHMKDKGLISDEKYRRLTRNTPFTEEEKWGFINRQLVETRQSTKAVAAIFQNLFPEAEVVYVKAGLASEFRHEYGLVKCRQINDLHHAKDAFLNIAVGNVYHCKFTRRFFSVNQVYSLNTDAIYKHEVKLGNEVVWKGQQSIDEVIQTMRKNNIHYTRFAFKRKGGLFDQMPLAKAEGLIPRKAGLDSEKYGGYRKAAASCFLLTRYVERGKKDKTEVMLVPVELMVTDHVFQNEANAQAYARRMIAQIIGKEETVLAEVGFPLGLRALKINTLFSFDGYRACLTGKSGGGKQLGYTSMVPLVCSEEEEQYIKYLENFEKKRSVNSKLMIVEEYDKITAEGNLKLYRMFRDKLDFGPYGKVFSSQVKVMEDGEEKFVKLSLEEQAKVLLGILSIFMTGRAGGCDLTLIGGSKQAATYKYGSKFSNWKKVYVDVRIIDISASGLHETWSQNLLELL